MLLNPNRVARGVWHVKNFRDIKFVDDFKKPNLPFYFIPREKLVKLKKKEKDFLEKSERI